MFQSSKDQERRRSIGEDGLVPSDLQEPLLNSALDLPLPHRSTTTANTTTTNTTATTSTTTNPRVRNGHIALRSDSSSDEDEDDDKNVVIRLCGRRYLRLNHNVFLNIVLSVLYGLSDSLWNGTVLVAYLKCLGRNKNGPVGDIEAINGLAVLFSALPIGYLADKYSRDKIIRAGGVLFIVTAILHAATMEWIGTDEADLTDHQRNVSLFMLAVVMALWGVGGGIVSGPCQALYADSTPAGKRSTYYHYLFVSYLFSSCFGPIISIILFQRLGDEWKMYQLRTIIYVGLIMESCNAILMMLFDDTKALDEDEGPPPTTPTNTNRSSEDCEVEVSADGAAEEDGSTTRLLTPTSNDGNDSDIDRSGAVVAASPHQWMIPYILFFSGLVFAIGSGITVKYFPLWFKDDVGMSPSQVQFIYVLVPLVMSFFSGVGTYIAKFLGRVETTLVLQALGISCLFAMATFKSYLDKHPFVLVPVYVLRTALMNCTYPLLESILMDFVPKQERARWKSLESISACGWCGSAAVGGYIADRWDYTHTFFVTAIIQTLGTLLQSSLLLMVPRFEHQQQIPPAHQNRSASDSNNSQEDNEEGGDRANPEEGDPQTVSG